MSISKTKKSEKKRGRGRPRIAQNPLVPIAIRLELADVRALSAYAARIGLDGPGDGLRALALEGLERTGLRTIRTGYR